MTKTIAIVLSVLSLSVINHQTASAFSGKGSQKLYLIENKGQVTDQYFMQRPDIQYLLQVPGLSVFIGNGQLHYQFSKTTIHEPDLPGRLMNDFKTNKQTVTPADLSSTIETYRMDVELVGANKSAQAIPSAPQAYYENYYLPGCPPDGAQAYTFGKVTYKNVYPGIDWVIYVKNNQLEHEFVIGPSGNASDIRLRYNGQTSLKLSDDGSLIATTPMGVIKEQAPVCISKDGSKTSSSYHLNGNILSYDVNRSGEMIIDPVLEWGTYYGPDSNNTSQYGIKCDNAGKIFTAGLTYSATSGNVATTGSYQATYGGGCDAFLVKFDTAGNRIWGTYYGGSNGDWANDVTVDKWGNIYIVGTTGSTSGISSTGCQQPSFGGGWDGFVVRFNAAGMRVWGTYAGGTGLDYPQSIACDTNGHVVIAGAADSYTNIATPGSFMPTHGGGHDDFMIQYDSSGLRTWGTYIGGNGDDFGGIVSCIGPYIYITGYTTSTTNITTPSTHQPTLSGTSDAFLIKFFSYGARIWGTYFGGPDPESVGGISSVGGYIYVLGSTNSNTGISTTGCYQASRAGLVDAFLARFNPDAGTVLWSTYFGGPDNENIDKSRITGTPIGDVYIAGYTASTSGVASTGAPQLTYGGGASDAFLAKFSPGGTFFWSTYYGGTGDDEIRACAFDGQNVYVAGQTTSPNNIATPGSFLDTGGGNPFYFQSCIAKYLVADTVIPPLLVGAQQLDGESLIAYPNPNNGSFTLSGSIADEGHVSITVSDITGKVLLKDEASIVQSRLTKQVQLPANAAAGIYFVEIASQHTAHVVRLVKEHGK